MTHNRRRGLVKWGKPEKSSTTETLKFGTWNVLTMYAALKFGQVTNEMRKMDYLLWESVKHNTLVPVKRHATRELLLYSGYEKENAPHT